MLIYDNLKYFSRTQPNKTCLIKGSTAITYKELDSMVNIFSHRMGNWVKKGDAILIKLNDPVRQLIYLLSISKLGAASVLIDPSTPQKLCADLMKKANAYFCIDDDFSLQNNEVKILPEVKAEDLFLGALSSGSTGAPKLIWRDHQSWVSAFPEQSRVFGLSGSDTMFLSGSLIYTGNLNSCLHILYEGGTVVFARNNLSRSWIEEIKGCNISSIFMVPANYRTLLKAAKTPMIHVKSIITAGSKMDIDTVRGLIKYFPEAKVYEYYGASELGHVSYSRTEDLLRNPSSVGKAFPKVNLRIENDLVWVESPYIAPDYKPKATVGDIGKVDKEGYLYLTGRKDNVINKGGVKISPEYVEEVLNSCPGITESAVKGIDEDIRGQKVAAWIVKSSPELTVKDIRAYCRQNLPRHACPQEFYFIEDIPRNINGKLDRNKLIRL